MAEYKTEQRRQLTEFMTKYSDLALSIDEWLEKLKEEGYTLGRTTVYRTLLKLEKEGTVISTKEQRHTHYQISTCCHDHLHLKCIGCGKLIHLNHDTSHALKSSILGDIGFSVDDVIYGKCEKCRS